MTFSFDSEEPVYEDTINYFWRGCVCCALCKRPIADAQIFVTNLGDVSALDGTVGKYSTSGAALNAPLIPGLFQPKGIAVSGDKLFVSSPGSNAIAEYTTSGVLVNPSVISGLNAPQALAVSGTDLFVVTDSLTSDSDSVVGKYTTSGATVNAAFLDNSLGEVLDVEVSGDRVFVARSNQGAIGE